MRYYQRRFQRKAHQDHMLDRCVILKPRPIQDPSGQAWIYWDKQPEQPCGFDYRLAREDFTTDSEIEKSFGFLRLGIGADIAKDDEVVIVYRNGEKLDPPWIFAVNGQPRQGPTAIIVGLREVPLPSDEEKRILSEIGGVNP
jgi:hypothetical protein